mmetsp:Transcript_7450/g.21711  ORF Transcript_7450/g.21711 Transcript_7450/m.21711 type:complete len:310 (-) Transcript_7450:142-1071(-)
MYASMQECERVCIERRVDGFGSGPGFRKGIQDSISFRSLFSIGHGFETDDNHQCQSHIVRSVDIDEVAIADRSDPILVNLDDFFSALLDGEVVLEDRSVDLPVLVAPDLDDKIVSHHTNSAFLDLGNLFAVGVLDGHGVSEPELAILDGVEGRPGAAFLQVKGFSEAEDLVVGVVGRLSPLVAPGHAVDAEGIAKGQELFFHGKGLWTPLVLVAAGRSGRPFASTIGDGRSGGDPPSHSEGGLEPAAILGRFGRRRRRLFASLVASVGDCGTGSHSHSDGHGGFYRGSTVLPAGFSTFASSLSDGHGVL